MAGRHKVEYLGRVRGALKSLEEIGEPMSRVLRRIDEIQGNTGEEYQIGPLFSSRGSLPFIVALDHLTRPDGPMPRIRVKPITHVFSTENLLEVVTGYGKIGPANPARSIQKIIDRIYTDVANGLSRSVGEAGLGNSDVLTDWDEVNTGANLRERMGIYNQLQLPEGLEFCVVSFIGNDGNNLKRHNVDGFKRVLKASPEGHRYMDIKTRGEITWSDHETFFKNIGLVYPGIAAPEPDTIRNILRRSDLPFFYAQFFKHYGEGLAKEIGRKPEEVINGIVRVSDGMYGVFNAEEFILRTSLDAYVKALQDVETSPSRSFKTGMKPLTGNFEFDIDEGRAYRIKRNGKEQVVLRRRTDNEYHKQRIPYRTPFTLFTRTEKSPFDVIREDMSKYLHEGK